MNRNYSADTELQKMKKQLEGAIKSQEIMKAANKIVKKYQALILKSTRPGIKVTKEQYIEQCAGELVKIGLKEKHAYEIQKPDFAGRIGFASYMLTNNNADIKRWTEKVDLLERKSKAEAQGQDEIPFDGGTVVFNFGIDRLQLVYDAKPDDASRAKIKEYGFIYAHSEGAWQRQLTDAACRSASRLLGIHIPAPGTQEVATEGQETATDESESFKREDDDINQAVENAEKAYIDSAEFEEESADPYFNREFSVFNLTDGVSVDAGPLTEIEADQVIANFPLRYEKQGFYLNANRERIDPREVNLVKMPLRDDRRR